MKRASLTLLIQAARLVVLALERELDDEVGDRDEPETKPSDTAPLRSIRRREAREELRKRGIVR